LKTFKPITTLLDLNKSIIAVTFFLLMANFNNGFAQKKVFSTGDDVLKTSIGDTIIIASDSAYVLSGGRAEYLNNRLNELDTIKLLYLSQSLHRD
jgi:hypothetical protein